MRHTLRFTPALGTFRQYPSAAPTKHCARQAKIH